MSDQRQKIRHLFYSTQEENRTLAFELAKGAGCYEAMVEEFYHLLMEFPDFEEEKQCYHEELEDEGETVPEGIELKRAYINYFTAYFFIPDVNLSRRYDYSNQDIKLKTFPKALLNMTFVKKLNLGWNALETLPEEIAQLKNLEELDLSCNKIYGGLPDVLGALTQLKTLVLYGMSRVFSERQYVHEDPDRDEYKNLFSPCIRRLKNLQYLDLGDVIVDAIPDWIHELQDLEYLSFFSGFGSHPYLSVPNTLTQLSRLKTFQVNAYSFDIPEDIDKMQSLECLVIEPALSIPASIKNLKNLKILDFSYLSSDYPITHPDYNSLWDLYDKGIPEGASRIELYGWEWLKEMTGLREFVFRHIEPYAFTEREREELEAALPNCSFTLKKE